MYLTNFHFYQSKNYLYSKPVKGLRGYEVGYGFAFNGKEKDDEGMGGGGSTYDYGFRIYNAQLGRFLSVDPLTRDYAFNSPYAFAENDVIRSIDLEGLEKLALSGTVPEEQYYKPDKKGVNPPGRTHYTPLHILLFGKQAQRLKRLFGFKPVKVSTGQDILKALETETTSHGSVSNVSIFGHAGTSGQASGIFLKSNAGFYTNNVDINSRSEGYATISDLVKKINDNKIVFSKDAKIFLNACNTVNVDNNNSVIPSENNLAYKLCLETGVTVIGCSGSMKQKTPGNSNGEFTTNGNFFKLTRVSEEYVENGETKTKYTVKSENLGNNIKVDNYAK